MLGFHVVGSANLCCVFSADLSASLLTQKCNQVLYVVLRHYCCTTCTSFLLYSLWTSLLLCCIIKT